MIKRFVRQRLFLLSLLLPLSALNNTVSYAETLPDIEAHEAQIVPIQISKSGRIYRFKMNPEFLPHTGNIILISSDHRPIMAFRVLKTDENSGELIGKRVRRYDAEHELKLEEKYVSVEKIADLLAPPPPEFGQYDPSAGPELDPNASKRLRPITNEKNVLDPNAKPELDPRPAKPSVENPSVPALMGTGGKDSTDGSPKSINGMDVEKFDEDLDGSTSPRNIKLKKATPSSDSYDDEIPSQLVETKSDFEVEEKNVLQPFKNSISIQAGSLKNLSNFTANATTNSGFLASYGHLLDRNVFITRSKSQDSLVFEAGFSYYSRTDFTGNNDDYTIFPLRAELQYHIHFNESFTLFGDVGLQYNFLFGSENINVSLHPIEQTALDSLTGPQPVLGIGAIYNIGPQWYLRADLGWDRLAFGLSVKW